MIRYLTLFFATLLISNLFAQSVNVENWKEDLRAYKMGLEENHIDLYNQISKADFEQELQGIESGLGEKTDTDVIIDLMRLTRKIGDGHTALSLRGIEKHLFPIEVYEVDGLWRVIKATREHEDLLGKVLTKIDGKPMDKIAGEVSEVAQYVENPQSLDIRTGQYLVISELLFGLDLTEKETQANFTFRNDDQKESDLILQAISEKDYYEISDFASFDIVIPEIEKPKNPKHDFLWFSPIENTDGVYIKFEGYPVFEEMEEFGASLLNYINQNKAKQVVIDLRNNGGGDYFVGIVLAYSLNLADSIDWKSGVYVLTDKVTFSAATTNATLFRQMLNAKIVGEPSGSNPTGYQDMGQIKLPNSGLNVSYSKRLFRFQEEITQGIQPDVLIEYDWESYSKGTDNMMAWIIGELRTAKER